MSIRRLTSRFSDALVAPSALFKEGLGVDGIWVMVASAFASLAVAYVFWNSQMGNSILITAQQATFARFGSRLPPDQYRQMLEHATPLGMLIQAQLSALVLRMIVSRLAFALLIGPVLIVIFAVSAPKWRDMFAIVGACSPVLVLRELAILLISHSRDTPQTAVGIWQILGRAGGCCGAEGTVSSGTSYFASFLANADPFTIWWLMLISFGIGTVYLGGRWKACAAAFLSGWLVVTLIGGYFSMYTANALASGRPAHQRLF